MRLSFYFFGGRRVSFNLSAVFGGASVVNPIPLFGVCDAFAENLGCLRVSPSLSCACPCWSL